MVQASYFPVPIASRHWHPYSDIDTPFLLLRLWEARVYRNHLQNPNQHSHAVCSSNDNSKHLRSAGPVRSPFRSEEHTSELQSRENLVCRLLLEKKKNKLKIYAS